MKKKIFLTAGIFFLFLVFFLVENSSENSSFFKANLLEDTSTEISSEDLKMAFEDKSFKVFEEKIEKKTSSLSGFLDFKNLVEKYPLKTNIEIFSLGNSEFFFSFLGIQKDSTRLVNEYGVLQKNKIQISPEGSIFQVKEGEYKNISSFPFPLDGDFLLIPSDKEVFLLSDSGKNFIAPNENFSLDINERFLGIESLKYGFTVMLIAE